MSGPAVATDRHTLNGTLGRADIAKCAMCKKGVMHAGVPIFFRVTVERFGVDMRAVQLAHGMEMVMGSPVMAAVFRAGRALANRMDLPGSLTVCMECAIKTTCVGHLAEITDLADVRAALDGQKA